MSYIQKKYGITPEQESKMFRDGVLNANLNLYYNIYEFHMDMVKAYKDMPQPKMTAVQDTCDMWRISQSQLYKIINIFK